MNPSETITTAQITISEDRRYAAMLDADLDTLDDLLSDDVIYTHSDASVDRRSRAPRGERPAGRTPRAGADGCIGYRAPRRPSGAALNREGKS